MNNQIKPAYVTFEQAKWLANKDYPQKSCNQGYTLDGQDSFDYTIDWLNKKAIVKPEQWQVVEWLRVNYGIHVFYGFEIETKKYTWEIWDDTKEQSHIYNSESSKWDFNSPQEAYSAAFDYIKEKELI